MSSVSIQHDCSTLGYWNIDYTFISFISQSKQHLCQFIFQAWNERLLMSGASLGKEEQINLKITAVVQACALTHRLPKSNDFVILAWLLFYWFQSWYHPLHWDPCLPAPCSILCGCTYVQNTSSWCPHSTYGCVWVGQRGKERESQC